MGLVHIHGHVCTLRLPSFLLREGCRACHLSCHNSRGRYIRTFHVLVTNKYVLFTGRQHVMIAARPAPPALNHPTIDFFVLLALLYLLHIVVCCIYVVVATQWVKLSNKSPRAALTPIHNISSITQRWGWRGLYQFGWRLHRYRHLQLGLHLALVLLIIESEVWTEQGSDRTLASAYYCHLLPYRYWPVPLLVRQALVSHSLWTH